MITVKTARELSRVQNEIESLTSILNAQRNPKSKDASFSFSGKTMVFDGEYRDSYLSITISLDLANEVLRKILNEKMEETSKLHKQAKIELENEN